MFEMRPRPAEDVRTQRYTEVFLIGGNVFKLVGGA